ncbi:hypothetical protein GCM10010178_80080 [Lentzea flava]|uniref:Uncharacterized protein n=1 Tax=Lentzea flava TaxID=103732 RepID=A0ABQ2VE30_9PSEU|nr:hypothetical protein GCM10010178_80080 [Lentzea flava]
MGGGRKVNRQAVHHPQSRYRMSKVVVRSAGDVQSVPMPLPKRLRKPATAQPASSRADKSVTEAQPPETPGTATADMQSATDLLAPRTASEATRPVPAPPALPRPVPRPPAGARPVPRPPITQRESPEPATVSSKPREEASQQEIRVVRRRERRLSAGARASVRTDGGSTDSTALVTKTTVRRVIGRRMS